MQKTHKARNHNRCNMLAHKRKYDTSRMHWQHRKKFWRFVEQKGEDECWPWRGTVHPRDDRKHGIRKGDPLTFIQGAGKSTNPQRIAYEATGAILSTQHRILCLCWNKFCCNPNHLYPDPTKPGTGKMKPEFTGVAARAKALELMRGAGWNRWDLWPPDPRDQRRLYFYGKAKTFEAQAHIADHTDSNPHAEYSLRPDNSDGAVSSEDA